MAARFKFPVVNERVVFSGDGIFSPEARAEALAAMARASIEEIDRENDAVVGRDVRYQTFVDGRRTSNLREARDTSVILARWDLAVGVVSYIWDILGKSGPVLTGKYRASARMYADGVEIDDPDKAIGAREVMFVPIVPYARKIERGKGRYAPGHVYEAVAAMANARFSNVARIKFTYAEPEGPAPALDVWASRHASMESSPRRRRAQLQKNRRNPAILVYLT
jgi:hypothetical protein